MPSEPEACVAGAVQYCLQAVALSFWELNVSFELKGASENFGKLEGRDSASAQSRAISMALLSLGFRVQSRLHGHGDALDVAGAMDFDLASSTSRMASTASTVSTVVGKGFPT